MVSKYDDTSSNIEDNEEELEDEERGAEGAETTYKHEKKPDFSLSFRYNSQHQ